MVHRFALEGYNEIAGTLVNHYFRNSSAVEILICEDPFNDSFKIFDVEVRKNGTYIQEIMPSSEEIKNCYNFGNEEEADSYLKRVKESFWRSNVDEFHFDISGIVPNVISFCLVKMTRFLLSQTHHQFYMVFYKNSF